MSTNLSSPSDAKAVGAVHRAGTTRPVGDLSVAGDARCRSGQPLGGRHAGECDQPQAEGSRFCAFHRDQLHGAMVGTSRKRPARFDGPKPVTQAPAAVEPPRPKPEAPTVTDAPKPVRRPRTGLSKAQALRAIAQHVAANPGVSRADLLAATGTTQHRLRDAITAGLIVGPGKGYRNDGYALPNNNPNLENAA